MVPLLQNMKTVNKSGMKIDNIVAAAKEKENKP